MSTSTLTAGTLRKFIFPDPTPARTGTKRTTIKSSIRVAKQVTK